MSNNHSELEKRLWGAADEFRANSDLKSSEYSVPVLGLIVLRYADHKFALAEKELSKGGSGRRKIGKTDYQAQGVLYLPEKARFAHLLNLPEGTDIGKAINEAMKAIETENENLRDVLPKTYNALEKNLLISLLKNFSSIPMTIEGDAFGKIYEYFLGNFAMSEGQKGGEFFTPTSLVKLIVEIIEPYHGRILDPACGSGGMFVQSAAFVEHHREGVNEISVYGQEKVAETIRLCKMNLAVHGLSGDIRQAVTYYEDLHKSVGRFDFVMANPPFNVDKVDKERIKDDPRYPFSLPKADNANYLWIQLFYSALNATGRAGFVMANSAGDARGSELDVRRELLKSGAVDVMVSIGSNFFYTVIHHLGMLSARVHLRGGSQPLGRFLFTPSEPDGVIEISYSQLRICWACGVVLRASATSYNEDFHVSERTLIMFSKLLACAGCGASRHAEYDWATYRGPSSTFSRL